MLLRHRRKWTGRRFFNDSSSVCGSSDQREQIWVDFQSEQENGGSDYDGYRLWINAWHVLAAAADAHNGDRIMDLMDAHTAPLHR